MTTEAEHQVDGVALPRGAVRLDKVSRSFRITHERNLTIKETILRGRRVAATHRWALKDVDLDISPGQAVGVIGENGAGKSTLLKVVAGILPPKSGTVRTGGSVAAMLELGAGFHPDFTGRENVFMNGAIMGLSEREVRQRLGTIIDFSELAESIDMPVRTYSSGMTMRLAFSIASHVNPDILLLDEVLAVGDEAFQRKCMGRIFDFRRGGGTLLLVSHDATNIERVCDRVILIKDGSIIADGGADDVLKEYHRQLSRRESKAPEQGAPASDEADEPNAWGNHKVVISNAHLEGPEGDALSFVSGDPVVVTFDIEAHEPVPQPCFGISFWTVEGQMLWGTNTNLDDFPTEMLVGRRTVRFEIDELPLHEGRFTFQVAVVSGDYSEVYHWIDRCDEFDVFKDAGGIGVVRVRGRWSVHAASMDPSG